AAGAGAPRRVPPMGEGERHLGTRADPHQRHGSLVERGRIVRYDEPSNARTAGLGAPTTTRQQPPPVPDARSDDRARHASDEYSDRRGSDGTLGARSGPARRGTHRSGVDTHSQPQTEKTAEASTDHGATARAVGADPEAVDGDEPNDGLIVAVGDR